MNIVNPQGVWLRNTAAFPLQDPEINHLFVPNQVVKIRRSDWAKAQPVIEVVDDPLAVAPVIEVVDDPLAVAPIIAAVPQAKPAAPAAKKLSPV